MARWRARRASGTGRLLGLAVSQFPALLLAATPAAAAATPADLQFHLIRLLLLPVYAMLP